MSQSNKVVVLGAGGMLGTHVIKAFELYAPELELISQTNERFSDSVGISLYLSELMPASVINCMGYLGKDPTLNFLINGCFPRTIVDWCDKNSSFCIHISTNAVFASDEEYCWGILDPLAPKSDYEVAKAFGEDPRAYVIRTSFVGKSPSGKGIFDRLCSGDPFVNRRWNGVTVWTLAKRLVEIVSQNHSSPKVSTEHLHSSGIITFSELAKIINSTSTCESYRQDARLLGGGIILQDIKAQVEEYLYEYPLKK